jgi:hypothetical protein
MSVLCDQRLPERFWSKVSVNDSTGCWEWAAGRGRNGYGRFRWGDATRYAHRVAYEELVGPVPLGLQLDHLCRVTHCCNPAHLEPVTPRENTLRGVARFVNLSKTACPAGHEYSSENTYMHKGSRYCRECGRQHARRRYYEGKLSGAKV